MQGKHANKTLLCTVGIILLSCSPLIGLVFLYLPQPAGQGSILEFDRLDIAALLASLALPLLVLRRLGIYLGADRRGALLPD